MKKIIFASFVFPIFVFAASQSEATVSFLDATGKVIGSAKLEQFRKGVKINLDVKGVSPGMHAIHFHEFGKCEGPKFTSAGGHLNPEKKEHGLENPKGHHLGDMPNVTANAEGVIKTSVIHESVTLVPGPRSLKKEGGVALVIHQSADDQRTDPSGNSGDRIACAVLNLD